MKITPMNHYVHVRKCIHDDVRDESGKVLVALPDESKERTTFVEVIAVGPKCKVFTPDAIGETVRCLQAYSSTLMHKIPNTEADFLMHEDILEPAIFT